MSEGFTKKKKYGQNFLTSDRIPARIAAESGITPDCGVLEIGPGLGVLTAQLTSAAKKTVAVEIDGELIPRLEARFAGCDGLTIIHADIMDIDLKQLTEEQFAEMPVCVCANLPYYITTPILMKLFESGVRFRTITVMVQKEVAKRLCSRCGSPDYGSITAAISRYASVKKLFDVKAGSFSPPPKVDSAVVRFDLYKEPLFSPADEHTYTAVLRAAFAQRRKTLLNALGAVFPDKDALKEMIAAENLKADVRGEAVPPEKLCNIADRIYFLKKE